MKHGSQEAGALANSDIGTLVQKEFCLYGQSTIITERGVWVFRRWQPSKVRTLGLDSASYESYQIVEGASVWGAWMHEGGFFAYRMRPTAIAHRMCTESLVLNLVNIINAEAL